MIDKINEIENLIDKAKSIEERLSLVNELVFYYLNYNPIKALSLGKKNYLESKDSKDKDLNFSIKLHLANAYFTVNDKENALKLYLELIKDINKIKNKYAYPLIMSNIALIFYYSWLFNQSIYIWKNLLNSNEVLSNLKLKNIIKANLINVYITNYNFIEFNIEEILTLIDFYEKEHNTLNEMYGNCIISVIQYYNIKEDFINGLKFCNLLEKNSTITLNKRHHYVLMSYYGIFNFKVNPKKSFSFVSKALNIGKKYNFNELNIELYKILYEFLKVDKQYQKANEVLENILFEENKIRVTKQNLVGYLDSESKNFIPFYFSNSFRNTIENNLFKFDNELYLENMKGNILKVHIESIISILSVEKQVKITFFNKKSIFFKISLQKIMELINLNFYKKHLLFHVNSRSGVVNLYWLHKIDKQKKMIILNVAGIEYQFTLTRRRFDELKKFIQN